MKGDQRIPSEVFEKLQQRLHRGNAPDLGGTADAWIRMLSLPLEVSCWSTTSKLSSRSMASFRHGDSTDGDEMIPGEAEAGGFHVHYHEAVLVEANSLAGRGQRLPGRQPLGGRRVEWGVPGNQRDHRLISGSPAPAWSAACAPGGRLP